MVFNFRVQAAGRARIQQRRAACYRRRPRLEDDSVEFLRADRSEDAWRQASWMTEALAKLDGLRRPAPLGSE